MTDLALQLAALDEDKVSPGLLGFTVVALLAAAVWLLLRSMNKQLKRVDFEEKPVERDLPAPRTGASDADAGGDEAAEASDGTAENRETQGNGAK